MIVKGSNEEAKMLNRCLESIAPYVDGIFITRTHVSGETPNPAVGNVAKQYNAHLSDFEWIDDFAAARNFNFSQVPKDYDFILWSDADDIWRGLEKLKPTLEESPNIDGMGFWYLYDWDEHKKPVVVHRKTMLIKNDGAARWVGAIHEDLEPTRSLDVKLVEGIERLHLSTSDRAKDNAERNLANSQFGVSDFEGARRSFDEFIETSQSPEQIYLARIRLANVYSSLGKRNECFKELQTAIGLFPSLPDAYLQLAYYHFDFDNMDKAEEYCLAGMVKRPQIMKMVVYNPRDYDYNPMMLLAKIYYRKHRPDLMLPLLKGCLKIYPNDKQLKKYIKDAEADKKMLAKALTQVQKLQKITDKEKLRAAIDALPEDLRSHPQIVVLRNQNFVKETSSGRDLVFYCGNTMETWNPELFKTKGFGGSEEAVIHMAEELAKLGWNVTVYNNCGHKTIHYPIICNPNSDSQFQSEITYRPFWEFNYRDKQDVVILWRWAKPLDAEINADKVFLELHDVISEGELTEKRLQKVTKIFVKSQFHRSLFPNVPDSKFAIIPNGLEIYPDASIEKDPMLVINTSSPDRSMDVLPKLWKEVKKQVPEARLQWAYGWNGFVNTYKDDTKKMQWMEDTKKEMAEAGIEDLGRITQEEVGKLYQKASIFAYPTEFAEIDCISARKAQAAGCIPVTTNFGALDETVKFGLKVKSNKTKNNWNRPYQFHFGLEDEESQKIWVESMVRVLSSNWKMASDVPELMKDWDKQFTWPKIAERWHKELI